MTDLLLVDTELLCVTGSELTEGEGPSVKTGTESDSTLLGVDLNITESLVVVGRDDDVDGLDGSVEGLVEVLLADLQLEKGSIDLVDDTDGLDSLGQSLTQDGLGLHTDTVNAVDDDEGTIGNSESSSDFRREIYVTGGVNQVDQELVACERAGLARCEKTILRAKAWAHSRSFGRWRRGPPSPSQSTWKWRWT